MISIIIPTYNEEVSLLKNNASYQDLSQIAELIFVDGGSNDRTIVLAGALGRVVVTKKNRASQMNLGARMAQQDILLFLHADGMIDENGLIKIQEAIDHKGYIGGCFSQVLDDPRLIYKWISWTGNVRAKMLKIFYGDQGIFVRRDTFFELGGFPEVQICEDILFSKKMKEIGKVDILPYPIWCSARRWREQGILKTFFINARMMTACVFTKDLDRVGVIYKDIRSSPSA